MADDEQKAVWTALRQKGHILSNLSWVQKDEVCVCIGVKNLRELEGANHFHDIVTATLSTLLCLQRITQ